MWSDAPTAEWLDAATARLRDLLVAEPPTHRRVELELSGAPLCWVERLRARGHRHTVWLDGGDTGRHLLTWAPRLIVEVEAGTCSVTAGDRSTRFAGRGLDLLAALEQAGEGSGLRAFGYLGYELAHELESLPQGPARDIHVPDMWLALADTWIEVEGERAVLVTRDAGWDEERIAALAATLAPDPGSPQLPTPRLEPAPVTLAPSDREYEAAVGRTVDRIRAGELFQTNLCRRFEATVRPPGGALYAALRATGDAAHGAWIATPTWDVLSRSPETFLRVRDQRVESVPIKGTRPRGASSAADRALRDELLSSAKDRAELAMIVDLVRNDLGRVCLPGSVEVAEHGRVMELATVWHTCSRIVGRLAPHSSSARLLRASFPPGSITGAPKIQAIATALAEEPARRGPAMGAIGWLDTGGDLELSVAIRTAVADRQRVVYHAGCGIVADSDPEQEREESRVKARPFLQAFGQ